MASFHRLALLTPFAICLATSATAQERAAPAAGSDTGEVVVTARKRAENVQTVPATVQVADEAVIAKAGVTSFADIRQVAPGVNISNAPSNGQFAVTIRGLGSKPGNPSFDSSVSLFVDGVYLPRAREFSNAMFDIGGLETVRGTQAALLGKNTSLGALNLIPKKPGTTFGGDLRYSHEFELGSDRVEGGVNIPVSDDLRVRVSGLYNDETGAIHNSIDGSDGPNTKARAGRIVAVWAPPGAFDASLIYQNSKSTSSGANAEFVAANAIPGTLATAAGYPGVFEANQDYRTAIYSSVLGGAAFGRQSGQLGELKLNWKLGGHTLTAQTGFTESTAKSQANVSYLPGNYLLQGINDKSKQFTEEVRLASPTGGRLEYIVGAFYLDGRYLNYTTTTANYPQLAPTAPKVAGSGITDFDQADHAYSVFGQANYRLVDAVKLTVGLRYTNEKKDVNLARQTLVPGLYSTVILPPYAPFSLSESEDNVDGSVGLSYQFRPNILLYTSWGQGTKAGGFAQAASALDKSRYSPEKAQTTEAGFKSQFLGGHVTVNGAAFYTTVKDFQLVAFNGVTFNVSNTDLKSYGFESEVDWRPMPGLTLFSNNTYADTTDTRTGSDTSFAPRWQGSVGGAYSWLLPHDLRASIDANLEYRSSELSQDQGVAVPQLHSSTRLNASIGIGDPVHGWELRLIGKNLNDEHVLSFDFPAPSIGAGNAVGIPFPPRTVMLQLSLKY